MSHVSLTIPAVLHAVRQINDTRSDNHAERLEATLRAIEIASSHGVAEHLLFEPTVCTTAPNRLACLQYLLTLTKDAVSLLEALQRCARCSGFTLPELATRPCNSWIATNIWCTAALDGGPEREMEVNVHSLLGAAVEANNIEIVKMLLAQCCADPHVTSSKGNATPLSFCNSPEMLGLLLAFGADPKDRFNTLNKLVFNSDRRACHSAEWFRLLVDVAGVDVADKDVTPGCLTALAALFCSKDGATIAFLVDRAPTVDPNEVAEWVEDLDQHGSPHLYASTTRAQLALLQGGLQRLLRDDAQL